MCYAVYGTHTVIECQNSVPMNPKNLCTKKNGTYCRNRALILKITGKGFDKLKITRSWVEPSYEW